MGYDNKPNLSDGQFEQCPGNVLHLSGCTIINGQININNACGLAAVCMLNGSSATQGLVWDTGSTLIKSVQIIEEWVTSEGGLTHTGQKFAYESQSIFQIDIGKCVTIPNYVLIKDINLQCVENTIALSIPVGKTAFLNRLKLIILNDATPTCFSLSVGNNYCADPSLSYNNLVNTQQISDVLTNETYELDITTRHQSVSYDSGSVIFFRVQSGSTSANTLCAHLLLESFLY